MTRIILFIAQKKVMRRPPRKTQVRLKQENKQIDTIKDSPFAKKSGTQDGVTHRSNPEVQQRRPSEVNEN